MSANRTEVRINFSSLGISDNVPNVDLKAEEKSLSGQSPRDSLPSIPQRRSPKTSDSDSRPRTAEEGGGNTSQSQMRNSQESNGKGKYQAFRKGQRPPSTRGGREGEKIVYGSNPDDVIGIQYRYMMPKGFVLQHFDVFCDWDMGQEALDTRELSREVQYQRQYYTWHAQHRQDSLNVRILQNTWNDFKRKGSASLEQMIAWIVSLRPRSIHDYKPLQVLLQAVVRILLDKELDCFSEETLRLRGELKAATDLVNRMSKELNSLHHASVKGLWQDAKRRTVSVNLFDNETARLLQLVQDAESARNKEENKYQILMSDKMLKEEQIDKLTVSCAGLREALTKATDDIRDKDEIIRQLREKNAELEKKNKEIAHQLQKIIHEGAGAFEEMTKEMKEDLDKAKEDAAAKKKRLSTMRFQKAGQKQAQENLKSHHGAIQAVMNTPFFNWAAFRPVVEAEWAAMLVAGQASLSVPWESKLRTPPGSKLPNNTHICTVPGGSVVETASQGKSKDHVLAIPAFAKVDFPEEHATKVGSGESATMVSAVTVPGGTSVILPNNGPMLMTVLVAPNTAIHPPKREKSEVKNPFGGGDGSFKRVRDKIESNVDGDGNEVKESMQMAPRGGNSAITTFAGSTLVSPMGVRSSLQVPSGCSYIFPMGQKRHMTVPPGTKVKLDNGGHATIMLPSDCEVTLPDYQSWRESTPNCTDMGFIEPTEEEEEQGSKLERAKSMKLQCSQPDCCIQCPARTTIELPQFCPYSTNKWKVTIPAYTEVEGPKDEYGIASKEHTFKVGVLPTTTLIVPGCRIIVPYVVQHLTPGIMAEKMKLIGPEASAAALGGLDPAMAANALSEDILGPKEAARILSYARTQPAAQVVRRISPEVVREILFHIADDTIAAILACFPAQQMSDLVHDFFDGDPDSIAIQRQMMATADRVAKATNLISAEGPVRHVVDILMPLDPRVTCRIIAGAQAARAAYVLSRMAGRIHGGESANLCAEQLNVMAKQIKQLSTRYHQHDIKRARLIEDLSQAKTENSLFYECVRVMKHLKNAYGIKCTLARMAHNEDDKIEDATAEIVAEEKKQNKKKLGKKGAKEKNANLGRKAKLTEMKAAQKKKSHQELMKEQAQTEEAASALDILCTMEDVSWNMPGGDELAGQRLDDAQKSGLGVQMNPKKLIDLQEEAFEKGEAVLEGVLLCIPVVLEDRTKWGTLSHVNRTAACEVTLGGLGTPDMNALPKACESLEIMAKAIGIAMVNIDKVTKDHYDDLVQVKDGEGFIFEKSFEECDDADLVDIEQAAMDLQSFTYWRRRVASKIQLDFMRETTAVDEVKGYQSPPRAVLLLMISLFVCLEKGIKGFADTMGPALLSLPKTDTDHQALWRHTQKLIKTDPSDPNNLPKLMANASKGLAAVTGNIPEDDLREMTMRARAVSCMMAEVTYEDVAYASSMAAQLMEWTYIQFKILDMTIKLAKCAAGYRPEDLADVL